MAMDPVGGCFNSGVQTADALITTGAGYLYGLVVITDGTNALTVAVYDNTSASGVLIVPTLQYPVTPRNNVHWFFPGIQFNLGIYVDITLGAGACAYSVYFQKI